MILHPYKYHLILMHKSHSNSEHTPLVLDGWPPNVAGMLEGSAMVTHIVEPKFGLKLFHLTYCLFYGHRMSNR